MTSPNNRSDLQSYLEKTLPNNHLLFDYFRESLDVIERLEILVPALEVGEDAHAAAIARSELESLQSFLREEIQAAANRMKAQWRCLRVTEHGLCGDGRTDNGPALRQLLKGLEKAEGYTRILFPEGVYYISNPGEPENLNLTDLARIAFVGEGAVTWLFDGRPGTGYNIRMRQCRELSFENLTIDNDPLPFSLGKIVAKPAGNQIEVVIEEGYPLPDASYQTAPYLRGVVKNAITGRINKACGDTRISALVSLGEGRFLLTLDTNARNNDPHIAEAIPLGEHFSIHPRERPHGKGESLKIIRCQHILLSHVRIHSANHAVYSANASAGLQMVDCDIEPAPGRVLVSNADAFHCGSNRKGPYFERCRIFQANDDCINLFTKLISIGEVIDEHTFTTTCRISMNERLYDFQAGDWVGFINANTGDVDGVTKIISTRKILRADGSDRLQILTESPVSGIMGRIALGRPDADISREYVPSGGENYHKAMAVDAPFEHFLLNLNTKNDGFIIRNCEMGHNRANGMRIQASNGTIRDTVLHDQRLIFLSETAWLEGTFPSKILLDHVRIDLGIQTHYTLPGKRIAEGEAARRMSHIEFRNVRDGEGRSITFPS